MLKQNERDELIVAHSNLPFPPFKILWFQRFPCIAHGFSVTGLFIFWCLSPKPEDKHLKEHFPIPAYYKTSTKLLIS